MATDDHTIDDELSWAVFYADQVLPLTPAEQAQALAQYTSMLAADRQVFEAFRAGVGWALTQNTNVTE